MTIIIPSVQTSEVVHGEGNLLNSLCRVSGEWKASNPSVGTFSGTRGCPTCKCTHIHIPNKWDNCPLRELSPWM